MVAGPRALTGTCVEAPDLRGGAALAIAGLAAEGITEVGSLYHIDRGYEDFTGKLRSLGAVVEQISAAPGSGRRLYETSVGQAPVGTAVGAATD